MRRVAAALAFVALTALGAAAADEAAPPKLKTKTDPEIGRCEKRVGEGERTCLQTATERCRATSETDLAGCYGTNADCARGCIADQTKCRADPSVDQDGCKLAGGSDQKVEIQRCRVDPDMKKCQGDAKVKALKCKQKCAVDAAPALQTCMRRFD